MAKYLRSYSPMSALSDVVGRLQVKSPTACRHPKSKNP